MKIHPFLRKPQLEGQWVLWGFEDGGHNLFGVPIRLPNSLLCFHPPRNPCSLTLPSGFQSSSSPVAGGPTLLGPSVPLAKKYLCLRLEKQGQR